MKNIKDNIDKLKINLRQERITNMNKNSEDNIKLINFMSDFNVIIKQSIRTNIHENLYRNLYNE